MLPSVCISGFVIALFTSGLFWYSAPVVAMIPFYWFGLWALPRLIQAKRSFAWLALLGCGTLIVVTFFSGNIATNGLSFYWNRFYVFRPTVHDAFLMFARYAIGILGSLFVLFLVMVIVPKIRKIALLGTETLGIYFLQGFFVREVANRITVLDSSVPMLLAVATLVYGLCFVIVKASKRNGILNAAIWGIKLPSANNKRLITNR